MNENIRLNREQYRNMRQMNRKRMEDLLTKIYNEGYTDGKAAAGPQIEISDVAVALNDHTGVDSKTSNEVIAALINIKGGKAR